MEDKEKQDNYMVLGMSYGVLAGSMGMVICSTFGKSNLGSACIGIGLLLGLVIGMMIPKKD